MIENIYLIGVAVTLILEFIIEPDIPYEEEDIFSTIVGVVFWPLTAFIIIFGLTVKGLGKIYEYFRNNKSK